jgi:hypothetical protein
VLVYRIDGQYVLDSDRMRAHDDRVINATHVSMVDTRRDAPVVVTFEIPSSDAAGFEVSVTFVCSVSDPVAVVRGGVDARTALWGYLQAHPRTFELGLDYRLSEINELRRAVSAQVTAYSTIKPPGVPGMAVRMASVTVKNPEFLVQYEERHRGKDYDSRLARQDQELEHRLRTGQLLNEQSIDTVKQDHTHLLADRDQVHGQAAAASGARHRREQAGEQAAFELDQFDRRMDAIGTDPRRALMAAFAGGHIDASALSERLRELDQLDMEAVQRERQLELDRQLEIESARQTDQREDRDAQRANERERREDEREERRWRREQQQLRDQQIREDEREKFRARVELLKQAANNGHFDTVNLQADRLYAEVVGLGPTPVDSAPKPEILASDPRSVAKDDAASQVNEDE